MQKIKRLKKKQRVRFIGIFWKMILPIILLILGGILFRTNTRYWNGKDKINVVEQKGDGNVSVKVYDPKLEEMVTLIIPGETEVSVSRNLGVLRLKNVWQLGVNEKIGGDLLAQTVTKNFLFSVFLWRGSDGSTNIPFGDRLLIWIFEKRTKNLQKTEIDLGKSQFVRKLKLSDGEIGYKLPGAISERLTVYFVDNDFVESPPKVYIKDATGTFGVSENVGRAIEVMGGKIVTIERAQTDDSDCLVRGKLAKKIDRVFDCKVDKGTSNFDLEIVLGKSFAKRF